MAPTRTHLVSAIVAIPILELSYQFGIKLLPFDRVGFFCDDTEIRLPYQRGDTVNIDVMHACYLLFSMIMIVVSELSLARHVCRRNAGHRLRRPSEQLHPVPANVAHLLMVLYCGYRAASAVAGVGKSTCSRLRPNFIDACRPANFSGLCPADREEHKYITEYTCTREIENDEYFSFPSGHATQSLYFTVFFIVYAQKRCKLPYLVRSLVQYALVLVAFFICMSRVRDHKHRMVDVASGAILGALVGDFIIRYVLYQFRPNRYELYRPVDDDTADAEAGLIARDHQHHQHSSAQTTLHPVFEKKKVAFVAGRHSSSEGYGSCTASSMENIFEESNRRQQQLQQQQQPLES